ncbi:hypothetical protein H0H92_012584 [Tricholoma furcatifolium]|nr:hypothetical protein H0H92_012584 [Tricholoma furcatifolium]
MASSSKPTSFILPDLVSHCPFPLTYHPDGDTVAQQSVEWLDTNCPDLSPKGRRALRGLQAGELTAFCYNTTTPERLRVVSDFMNYLFHLDNISDGMMTRETDVLSDVVMNALWFSDRYVPTTAKGKEQPAEEVNPGKLARDFWARCIVDAGPGVQERFKETLGLFFEAVNIQAKARDADVIPDLESYIDVRRDTSGCKPCWALIEYALDIDLPDFVIEHPVIQNLNRWTNDLVTWSNDIFSYNVEQARGDTHNMIVILMKSQNLSLQEAVDFVGDLCEQTIIGFIEDRKRIPPWSPDIDLMVERYVEGLQNWIVGPFTRTTIFRSSPLIRRQFARPVLAASTLYHKRTIASAVSNRPGSQTLEHAALNIREEVGNSAADLAKIIAGANIRDEPLLPEGTTSFASGLPYMAASGITVYLAHSAGMAASGLDTTLDPGVALTLLDQALNIQVTYGAVMLSFLGALHWGMEFAGYGGQKGYPRLILGSVPVLFAWPTLALQPMVALVWQWFGFTALWYADAKVTALGWRTSYYGPVAGHGFLSRDLDLLREERRKHLPQRSGFIPGEIEAAPAGENVDHYVRIHHRNHDHPSGQEAESVSH